jgi:hypothetical protein
MEETPTDVVDYMIMPFLQLRDLKSLRSVSTRVCGGLSANNTTYDFRPYVCCCQRCSNRLFWHTSIDPFIDHDPSRVNLMLALVEFVVSICIFPLYCVSFYTILYNMIIQSLSAFAVPQSMIDTACMDLKTAVDSYRATEDWVHAYTSIRPVDFCTCVNLLQYRSGYRSPDCVHVDLCTRTEDGGCIHCIIESTPVKLEWCLDTIPFSFYVYLVCYALFPMSIMSVFLLLLFSILFMFGGMIVFCCFPLFLVYILQMV